MKKALIFGVDGQDGSYLAEHLLEKGYAVHGWLPQGITPVEENLSTLREHIALLTGDLTSQPSLRATLEEVHPDEVYNLAAPSFPAGSWHAAVQVGDIAGLGAVRILEAIRQVVPQARFFQASSSEIFGIPDRVPQDEHTSFRPRNPYGVAKLYAHWSVVTFREQYNLFATTGILYNHESPRRGPKFVTRKISLGAARIKLGLANELRLGDLEACRDWGFAGDYVQAMATMLQAGSPDDYVIGSGQSHSVRQFCELAFAALNLDYRDYVVQDPTLVRPPETVKLVADPSKARRTLGWQPSLDFPSLVRLMVISDFERLRG